MSAFSQKRPVLNVAGALHVDEVATVQGKLVAQASNPVSWRRYVGGVGCNAALAALAVYQQAEKGTVCLHAALGDDTNGLALVERVWEEGLRVRQQVIEAMASGRYTAVICESGELELGLADVQLAERLRAEPVIAAMAEVANSTLLVDANLSPQCLDTLFNSACSTVARVVALTVSPSKAIRLLPHAKSIDLLFCNRREAFSLAVESGIDTLASSAQEASLRQLSDALVGIGFNDFVLTDGSAELITRHNKHVALHKPPSVNVTHNVNGAGDTLAGATLAALTLGESLEDAVVDHGLHMAASVLSGRRLPLAL